MTKPGYQAILAQNIPEVKLPLVEGGGVEDAEQQATARLIAGELGDAKGAAKTVSPVQMWDVNIPKKDAIVDLPYPAHHNCIVFVRRGGVKVLSSSSSSDDEELKVNKLGPQDVALMHYDGSNVVRLQATQDDSSVMILGGEPIDEPIAAHGPFVMNTHEEINQASSDYRMGKFGR